jgi:hypothetical protein
MGLAAVYGLLASSSFVIGVTIGLLTSPLGGWSRRSSPSAPECSSRP